MIRESEQKLSLGGFDVSPGIQIGGNLTPIRADGRRESIGSKGQIPKFFKGLNEDEGIIDNKMTE